MELVFSIDRLNNLLTGLLGTKDLVETWWNSPNKAFNNSTPISIWETEPNRVREYVLKQFRY